MSSTQHHIKRPVTFLSLAPVHSQSYPKAPASPVAKSPVENNLAAAAKPADGIITAPTSPVTTRRHSSTGSVGSQRFLKLGPVHWGGDNGGNDYAIDEWARVFYTFGICFCLNYGNLESLAFFFFFFSFFKSWFFGFWFLHFLVGASYYYYYYYYYYYLLLLAFFWSCPYIFIIIIIIIIITSGHHF